MRNPAHRSQAGNPGVSSASAVAFQGYVLDILQVFARHEWYCSARVAQVVKPYPGRPRRLYSAPETLVGEVRRFRGRVLPVGNTKPDTLALCWARRSLRTRTAVEDGSISPLCEVR
jgi:hypothetical protein